MKLLRAFAYIIFAGIISFSLIGCDTLDELSDSINKAEVAVSAEPEVTVTPKPTSKPSPSPSPTPELNGEDFATEYYTITIPEEIKKLYKAETVDTDNAYNLCVYDKQSIAAGMNGFVFAICLYKSRSDYETAPAYDYIGTLTVDGDDTYYVSMEYATDVQYTDSTEESWRKIYKCEDNIRESLKANSSAKAVLSRSSGNGGSSTSTNSGSEKDSNNSDNNKQYTICKSCNGLGHCPHCLYGACYMCGGSGTETCFSCIGSGKCGQCGGDGYYYSGVGSSFGKRQCGSCGGLGRCRTCGGTGKQSCSICYGSGKCSYCGGRYTCDYCGGKGYIE